jgi:carbonic anhydrase
MFSSRIFRVGVGCDAALVVVVDDHDVPEVDGEARDHGLELLEDAGLGDLFVVRNAGNNAFTAAIGSLEYAVAHLGVTLIVVLGHERCGAVSAALDFSAHLTPALGQVVGQVRMQLMAAEALDDLDKACRANVQRSAQNLVDASVLLTDRVRQGRLQVETGYYDLDTAEISWLGAVQAAPAN